MAKRRAKTVLVTSAAEALDVVAASLGMGWGYQSKNDAYEMLRHVFLLRGVEPERADLAALAVIQSTAASIVGRRITTEFLFSPVLDALQANVEKIAPRAND